MKCQDKTIQAKKIEMKELQEKLLRMIFTEGDHQQEIESLKAKIKEAAGEEYEPSSYASALSYIKEERMNMVRSELMDETTGQPKPFALAMMLRKLGVIQFAA